MPFVPEPEFPDLSQLIVTLNNAQISVKNPALYQTIKGLIQKVQSLKDLAQEDIDAINQSITDLSNTINNITTGNTIVMPPPWMPVFDGVDGDDAFPIPGRDGKDGIDGKSIPNFCEHECVEPPPLLAPCCPDAASEFTSTSTGNVDDLDFGNAALIRFNNATDTTLRGLKAGLAGQLVTIVSIGAGHVFLEHENAGSAAANRLTNNVTSGPTPLATAVGKATYRYDGTTQRWRLIAHMQGQYIDIPHASTTYDSDTGAFWTVDAADVVDQKILIIDRIAQIICTFANTTTLAGVGSRLRADFSGYKTWTWKTTTRNWIRANEAGVITNGMATCAAATSRIQFSNLVTDPAWGVGVNNRTIDGATIMLGVN